MQKVKLKKFFFTKIINIYLIKKYCKYFLKICCKYETLINASTFFKNSNIEVMSGYFQSYRYFHLYKKLILKDFTFLPGIYKRSNEILNAVKQKRINSDLIFFNKRFEGIKM